MAAEKNYSGKILLATPDSSGSIFSRAVVLIIEHSKEGAFGFILNKLEHSSSRISIPNSISFDKDIYCGGPVMQGERFFFLVKSDEYLELDNHFAPNFYLSGDSEKTLEYIISKKIAPEDIKLFSGYSGWSAHQLDNEIAKKQWVVIDGEEIDYTAYADQSLWKKLMKKLGGDYSLWANTPNDVHWN